MISFGGFTQGLFLFLSMTQQLQFSTQVHWPPYFLITWSPYTTARPIIIPYTCEKSLSIVSNIIALITQINFAVIQCLLNHTSFCKFYSFRYYAMTFLYALFPSGRSPFKTLLFATFTADIFTMPPE